MNNLLPEKQYDNKYLDYVITRCLDKSEMNRIRRREDGTFDVEIIDNYEEIWSDHVRDIGTLVVTDRERKKLIKDNRVDTKAAPIRDIVEGNHICYGDYKVENTCISSTPIVQVIVKYKNDKYAKTLDGRIAMVRKIKTLTNK